MNDRREEDLYQVNKEVEGCEKRKQACFRLPGSPRPSPGSPSRGPWALVLAPHCPLSVPSWHTVIVNGHSVEELCKAFSQAKHQPTAIIAKTFKGRGISGPYARVSLLPLGMGPVAN